MKRSQYYVAHSYVSQIGQGSSYFELKPIVLVAISNFELFTESKDPISFHKTLNITTQENHLKDLSYVFVELPKFEKKAEELQTLEDQWLYYLKNAKEIEEVPQSIINDEIREAYKSLEQFKWSKGEYDSYVKANILITDEYRRQTKRYEEGLKEGEEKGMEKGIEKGMEQEKKSLALNLLKEGMTLSKVSSLTNLPEDDVRKINETIQ